MLQAAKHSALAHRCLPCAALSSATHPRGAPGLALRHKLQEACNRESGVHDPAQQRQGLKAGACAPPSLPHAPPGPAPHCPCSIFDNPLDAKRTLREIQILRHLRGHSNVVGLLDAFPPPVGPHAYKDVYVVYEVRAGQGGGKSGAGGGGGGGLLLW